MKSFYNFYEKMSDIARELVRAYISTTGYYLNISEHVVEDAIKLENGTYDVEDRDCDGYLFGTRKVVVNLDNLPARRAELRKLLDEYKEYNIRMHERMEMKKRQREAANAIETLGCTMISRKEAAAMVKEIGCAVFNKTFIKVQKWANEEKTRYWPKQRATIMKIKCRIFNDTYCKEDILKAIAA